MTNKPIQVYYKYVDGAHFFFSTEKEGAGLCAANCDLRRAFDAVAKQLHILYKEGRGENVTFTPTIPFEIFANKVQHLIPEFDSVPNDDLQLAAIAKWTKGEDVHLQ